MAPVFDVWTSRLAEIDASWNPSPWPERIFQGELVNPASRVRGVFSDAKLVGYLIAHVVLDEAHVVSLGVAVEYQKRGFGTLLLADCIRTCEAEGVSRITLQVRVSNEVALRLYRRFGFCIVGLRKKYYSDNGEDAVTMLREKVRVR